VSDLLKGLPLVGGLLGSGGGGDLLGGSGSGDGDAIDPSVSSFFWIYHILIFWPKIPTVNLPKSIYCSNRLFRRVNRVRIPMPLQTTPLESLLGILSPASWILLRLRRLTPNAESTTM
jgi:hypothetical protein